MTKQFRVLIGTDGSPSARAALATALAFPWPEPSRARGAVALGATSAFPGAGTFGAAMVRALHAQADVARKALRSRWPGADVVELHEPPVAAILHEARRFSAGAIVLGWRGQGTFKRLLVGSVSRDVVAAASCPVMVVRTARPAIRRFVVGFDGRPSARRAVRFLSRLTATRGGKIALVNALEPLVSPPTSRIPRAAREAISAEIAALSRRRWMQASTRLAHAAALLKGGGWSVSTDVRSGAPLASLLRAAADLDADALVLGARATSGLARALIGSVAVGALNASPIPVVIVP